MKRLSSRNLAALFTLALVLIVGCGNVKSKTTRLGGGDGHGFEINRLKSLKCLGDDVELVIAQSSIPAEFVATLKTSLPTKAAAGQSSVIKKIEPELTIFERVDFTLSVQTLSPNDEWNGIVHIAPSYLDVVCKQISITTPR